MARLVWQRKSGSSMKTWAKHRPTDAVTSRLALSMSAGQSKRGHGYYLQPLYSLVALEDGRCAPAQSAAIVRHFDEVRGCCHRAGLAQHLKRTRADLQVL